MFDPTKPPVSLAELAHRTFVRHAEAPFLGEKPKGGAYVYASYGNIAMRVRNLALGLLELGLQRGERAAILAESRAQWAIADLACQTIGVATVPMFSTLPPAQVRAIVADSGASLVFVSNQAQWEKVASIRHELPGLLHAVAMDPVEAAEVLPFSALEARGEAYGSANSGLYEMTWPAAQADDLATIIYTSGTTGEPKGVMLCQRNIISNLEAIINVLSLSHQDSFLSFLPLSHIYERTAGFYLPLRLGAAIAFTESLFSVMANLAEVQPTIMFCVPRLLETMGDKLCDAGKSMPEAQRAGYDAALALARKAGAARGHLPGAPPLGLMEQIKLRVYDAKVYARIREKFGGRLRAFVSGGAPLQPELAALFLGVGVTLLEGYGLTETSPVIAVNRPGRVHLGTVGELVGSVEVRIADDGEILVRGDSVMKGYWNKPEATAEAIDGDRWFHTGDIGELNDGVLRITDRKKDLLVLANGKKVAPAPIELHLRLSRYIDQAVLLGDRQKSVTALVVPNLEAVRAYAKENNVSAVDDEALLTCAPINQLFRSEIDRLTVDLADFEKIRKFHLMPQPFTVEGGELTPTLKVKRNVVVKKYEELLGE